MNNYLSRAGYTLLIMAVVVPGLIIAVRSQNNAQEGVASGQTSIAQAELPQSSAQNEFEDLLDAIEWVESQGDPNAIGDDGKAIGAYQIWKIYVDDVNRIFKLYIRPMYQKGGLYTYEDRRDRDKSREMTAIVIQHYGKGNIEYMARIHNGGGNGHRKESTKPYWAKVKARLEE